VTAAIPITLLTGYLGSGKTTLLARLLKDPALADTAVLVNEFGAIALDHQLLFSAQESIVLLERGCLCCALRSDLAEQLDQLYTRRMRNELPQFKRVVIETTGLADPAPILQTLVNEPVLAALYRLDGVVATVDGEHGERELDQHFESVKQAALADRLVVTKIDRVGEDQLVALEARLRALNPSAPIVRAAHGAVEVCALVDCGLHDAEGRLAGVERWLQANRYHPLSALQSTPFGAGSRHDERIRSFALTYDAPVIGQRLWDGLEQLIQASGEKLLRIKGIVNVAGQAQPRAIHIVQHVLYPVTTLPQWPDADRRTRLVFIVRDLDPAQVHATLARALNEPV
jgi:G3E family GTPase